MSNLQISLAIAGGAILAAVVAYNTWTSRKNEPRKPEPEPDSQHAGTDLTDPLARRRWHNACQLLVEAQEAARLQALDEAGWLPAPLLECAHHLPDDVRNWLAKPPAADT